MPFNAPIKLELDLKNPLIPNCLLPRGKFSESPGCIFHHSKKFSFNGLFPVIMNHSLLESFLWLEDKNHKRYAETKDTYWMLMVLQLRMLMHNGILAGILAGN